MALVLWRYTPSLWAYACLSLVAVIYSVQNKAQLRTKSGLRLQFQPNQWYVVDHLGEHYEVRLLHSWRSPWCVNLRFANPQEMVCTHKMGALMANMYSYLNQPSFSLRLWRQQFTSTNWRDLNLALNRCNSYSDREHTEELS